MKKRMTFIITALMMTAMVYGCVQAQEAPELIEVEAPELSENGSWSFDGIYDLAIDPSAVEVSEEEVESGVNGILYAKDAGESDEEFVQRYSAEYLRKTLSTVEELREYIREDLYDSKLQAAIFEVLRSRFYVEAYSEDQFATLKEYARQELQRAVEMNSLTGADEQDEETVARNLGYASAEDFLNEEAMYYGKSVMLLDMLAEMEGITYSETDVENAILDLMEYYGYGEETSLDEYIALNGGDVWKYMVEKLNVEYHKVLTALEEYAVIGTADGEATEGTQEPAAENRTSEYGYTNLIAFTVSTLDGTTLSQDLFADKDLTIMNVWATWCGFCLEEMPELAEYAASLPDNIQFITYCADGLQSQELAAQILEESGLAALDPITIVGGTDDFEKLNGQLMYLPTTLFFNSRGEIVAEPVIGGQTDLKTTLDEHVEQALGHAE